MTSDIEAAILSSNDPILISDEKAKEILMKANGEKVILLNKNEIDNWIGPIPINEYPINKDSSPIIINKKTKPIEVKQHVSVKYLEPPSLQQPGEIIIKQEANKLIPPAPPLIIRQIPNSPAEPEALIIRELPPEPPLPPPKKIITIAGKMLPPPPRKLIIEKLPEMPDKRPDIILERWLPYKDVPRKITLVPKPTSEIEQIVSCANDKEYDDDKDDRKYSVQSPIFINNSVSPNPMSSYQYKSKSQSNNLLQQSNMKPQSSFSSYKTVKNFQRNTNLKTNQMNKSCQSGLQSMPTISNFSMIQQNMMSNHMHGGGGAAGGGNNGGLQSAFSNPAIFQPSTSPSSFLATPYFQPNYLQNSFFMPGFYSPKKMPTYGTNFLYPSYIHTGSGDLKLI